METDSVIKLISFFIFTILCILEFLGFKLASKMFFTLLALLNLIYTLSKSTREVRRYVYLFLSIAFIPFAVLIYAAFYAPGNAYLLFGSEICFFISFPLCFIIIAILKKRHSSNS